MRNYFNKALLFQQWMTLRFPILGFVFLWVITCRSQTRNELGSLYRQVVSGVLGKFSYGPTIDFTLISYAIIISLIAVMISLGRNKYNNFIFYGAQPITRKQFIGTKGIVISICAVVMILIDYYIRILSYLEHRNFYEAFKINYLSIISIRELILVSFTIAAIAFFFFIQGLYSNAIVSSLVGIGVIYYIPYLFNIIHETLSDRFTLIKYYLGRIIVYINTSYDSGLPITGANKFAKWYLEFTSFKFINYQHYLLVVILILISSILWILNFKIYNKIHVEKVGSIFHFNVCEKIFKSAIAIFGGLASPIVVMTFLFGFQDVYWGTEQYYFQQNVLAALNIVSLFIIPIIYKLEGKLIKRFVKN